MIEELLKDNVSEQTLGSHTLGQWHYRERGYLKGFSLRFLYLEIRFQHQLVTDDAAHIHLCGNQHQCVRHHVFRTGDGHPEGPPVKHL